MTATAERLQPSRERLQADLEAIAGYTDPDAPGWTRRVFSEPYRASRGWVMARMREAGLDVHQDSAGNIIGVRAGQRGGSALVTGSHTDTVHGGGRFDGIVGVLAGIEVARMLAESDVKLRHELRVVDFLGEEPNDFALSCVGSRAVSGQLTDEHLDYVSDEGIRLADSLSAFGLDPAAALSARWDPAEVAAFVELHIEQGPRLERKRTGIGVVTGIAGIERLVATFLGRADHAGTMPMAERRDALSAAAAAVLAIEQAVSCAGPDAVATTGRIESAPGALNVVPERARMWTEIRAPEATGLDAAKRRLAEEVAALARERGIGVDLRWLTDQRPVPVPRSMQDEIAAAAQEVGQQWAAVPSGAGHDAAHMASLAPMGMIFVPSRAGKSHCPEEWTDLGPIADGARVLAATLLRLDRRMP